MVEEVRGLSGLISIINRHAHPALAHVLASWLKRRLDRVVDHFTNRAHYELLRHITPKWLHEIVLTPNYAVITIENKYVHRYVLGHDNGKVFVQGLQEGAVLWVEHGLREEYHVYDHGGKHVIIYTYVLDNDRVVWSLLGYDIDCILTGLWFIDNEARRYRLQGDIVIDVVAVDGEAEAQYRQIVRLSLRRAMLNAILGEIAHRIQQILSDYGITSEARIDQSEAIARFETNTRLNEVQRRKLLRLIIENLYWEDIVGSIDSIIARSDIVEATAYVSEGDGVHMREVFRVYVDYGNKPYGSDTYIYTVAFQFLWPMIDEIPLRHVDDVLRDFKPDVRRRTITLGRHRVSFDGYPTHLVFQYTPRFRLTHTTPPLMLSVRLNEYYIAPSTLRLEHPEHGVNEYTVTKPLFATFTNTATSTHFTAKLNAWSVRTLPVQPLQPGKVKFEWV